MESVIFVSFFASFLEKPGCFFRRPLSSSFVQVRLQKAFRHPLNASIVMLPEPGSLRQVKLQIAMFNGTMVSFANVHQSKDANRYIRASFLAFVALSRVRWRAYCESHSIPCRLSRGPAAIRVAKVAEGVQNLLRGKLAFMSRSSTVTAPAASEGKSRRVRPGAILQWLDGHEVWAGQFAFLRL
jgi:hypothetical protein